MRLISWSLECIQRLVTNPAGDLEMDSLVVSTYKRRLCVFLHSSSVARVCSLKPGICTFQHSGFWKPRMRLNYWLWSERTFTGHECGTEVRPGSTPGPSLDLLVDSKTGAHLFCGHNRHIHPTSRLRPMWFRPSHCDFPAGDIPCPRYQTSSFQVRGSPQKQIFWLLATCCYFCSQKTNE